MPVGWSSRYGSHSQGGPSSSKRSQKSPAFRTANFQTSRNELIGEGSDAPNHRRPNALASKNANRTVQHCSPGISRAQPIQLATHRTATWQMRQAIPGYKYPLSVQRAAVVAAEIASQPQTNHALPRRCISPLIKRVPDGS